MQVRKQSVALGDRPLANFSSTYAVQDDVVNTHDSDVPYSNIS